MHDLHATILHLLGLDHEAHLPLRRPRLPADRRGGRSGPQDHRLTPHVAAAWFIPSTNAATTYARKPRNYNYRPTA